MIKSIILAITITILSTSISLAQSTNPSPIRDCYAYDCSSSQTHIPGNVNIVLQLEQTCGSHCHNSFWLRNEQTRDVILRVGGVGAFVLVNVNQLVIFVPYTNSRYSLCCPDMYTITTYTIANDDIVGEGSTRVIHSDGLQNTVDGLQRNGFIFPFSN